MLEVIVWTLSMLAAAGTSFLLSEKILGAQVDRLTISERNANILARTYRSNALSYILAIPVLIFAAIFTEALPLVQEWWILEIFIFWNLRSAFIYYAAIKRFQWTS
jgi:hypothetical protein